MNHCPGCSGISYDDLLDGERAIGPNSPKCPGCPSCAEKDHRIAELEKDNITLDNSLTQCRALLKQECDDVVPLRERIAELEESLTVATKIKEEEKKIIIAEVEKNTTLKAATLRLVEALEDYRNWMKNSQGCSGIVTCKLCKSADIALYDPIIPELRRE
jgi:hypothetical protein